MDNKITKSRLSNFLSYEWIIIIAMIAVSIFVFEMIYPIAAVAPTVGQNFTFCYDENVSSSSDLEIKGMLRTENAFSYDILEINHEGFNSSNNYLNLRLGVQGVDVLITDMETKTTDEISTSRINYVVDEFMAYPMDKLIADANEYVSGFVTNFDKSDLSTLALNEDAIRENFNKRMAGDNRYRFSAEEKEKGFELEKQRIEKLCKDIVDFEKLLAHPAGLFYEYTKYQDKIQYYKEGTENRQKYEALLAEEQPQKYGLMVEKLADFPGAGKDNPSKYFKKQGGVTSAKDVVIMAFDFKQYQPDLQYETISFINTIVRKCSTILD